MAASKKILLDHCIPKPLKRELISDAVTHISELNWQKFADRELLSLADKNFDVFITVDRNIFFQQNLAPHKIAIVVLIARSNRLEALQPLISKLIAALNVIQPGDFIEIENK